METIGAIFSESILVSLLGLSIVFIALVAISLIIVAFSKIFSGKEELVKASTAQVTPIPRAPAATPPADTGEAELIAAVIAAVTEESGSDSIVTSIAEVR